MRTHDKIVASDILKLNIDGHSAVVVIDFETIELTPDGPIASTEAYRPNFRVDSCAFAYDDGRPSMFVQGEEAVRAALLAIGDAPVIVHNLGFEMLVASCRFPHLSLNWHADTMRLAQLFDNGGDDSAFEYLIDPDEILEEGDMPTIKRKPISGLGLVVCNKRILGAKESHKEEAHGWLRENVPGAKGKEGSLLHLLPLDILTRYNIADADITLALYRHTTAYFTASGFDWSLDWRLYSSTVRHIAAAKAEGVEVDRALLVTNIAIVREEVRIIEAAFLDKYAHHMQRIEYTRAINWILGVKTLNGQRKRLAAFYAQGKAAMKVIRFNTGSNKQLAELFVGQLGIQPIFFTAKGAPAFKSAMLGQWGEGGEMLKTRRKRMLVLSQMESLLELSAFDGRWHVDLKACGTSTGRMAGGRS